LFVACSMRSNAPRQPLDARSWEVRMAPSDTCGIIEFIFLILGTGYMLSYNTLITPIDYYNAIYSEYHKSIMYYIIPIHRASLLVALFMMITPCFTYNHNSNNNQNPQTHRQKSWHLLITLPFVIIFIALSVYPFLPQYIADHNNESIYFMILLIICSVCGFFGGIIQCSVTDFCNYLPPQYMKASVSGQAMAGIIACALKIITKLIQQTDYTLTGKIYFLLGGLINLLCAILFAGINNTELIRYYLDPRNLLQRDYHDVLSRYDSLPLSKLTQQRIQHRKLEREHRERQQHRVEAQQNMQMDPRAKLLPNHREGPAVHCELKYADVFKEISSLAIGAFVVMAVTFLYFPGLLLSIKSQYKVFDDGAGQDWLGILLLTEYNVFDYVGRQFLVKWKSRLHAGNIVMVTVFRGFVVYPVFYVLYQRYVISDVLLHGINILGAATNGYCVCLVFMFLSELSNTKKKRKDNRFVFNHMSATIMTLALNLGILVGSIAAILIEKFVL